MPVELIIMAKAPEPGRVKTRLTPALSPERAAALQAALTEDAVALSVTTASLMTSPCAAAPARRLRVSLACSPSADHPFFQQLAARRGVGLLEQGGGDLGERMDRLQRRAFELGALAVIFIGVDAPAVTGACLPAALARLDEASVVIGPAEDGGYTLLGSIRPTPALFVDMPWGTGQVLERTRQRLRAEEVDWAELEPGWDVDRPADLMRLKTLLLQQPGLAPRTARALAGFERAR